MVYLLMFLSIALAEDPEDSKVVYKKETEIDFEGIEIEGQLVKPQGGLIIERKTATFNPLIKLRKDFDLEMSESVENIK